MKFASDRTLLLDNNSVRNFDALHLLMELEVSKRIDHWLKINIQ